MVVVVVVVMIEATIKIPKDIIEGMLPKNATLNKTLKLQE